MLRDTRRPGPGPGPEPGGARARGAAARPVAHAGRAGRHAGRAGIAAAVTAGLAAALGLAAGAAVATERVEITGRRDDAATDTVQPTQRLSGERLRRRAAATLGATLESEPGLGNASFGPNVGLPVIRGLGGSRVRVLVGGSGTFDASTYSADHAVMTEPLLAESVTVRRGPAAVRHGGAGIGGAVEVDDGRLPRTARQGLHGRAELRAGAGQRAGVARLALGGGGERTAEAEPGPARWALQADAHGRRHDDQRIPGAALDEAALRAQFGLSTARNSIGRVPNTAARGEGGAFGAGWFGADGSRAVTAVSTLRADYGVPPGGHSHGGAADAADAERVRIGARQDRADARADIVLGHPVVEALALRLTGTRYRHDERENGVVQTRFEHDVFDLGAEVAHAWLGRAADGEPSGRAGVAATRRRFSALGEEPFAPQTRLQTAGAFVEQAFAHGPWRLEAGWRGELQASQPDAYDLERDGLRITKRPPERRFESHSLSLALRRVVAGGHVTATAWHAERAPDLQELYADGPHLASRSYDIGNENLGVERLAGLDLAGAVRIGAWQARANLFGYRSGSFIVQRSLGRYYNTDVRAVRFECARLEVCLPVMRYEQLGARLRGGEVALAHHWSGAGWQAETRLEAAWVRGRLVGAGDIPRLPPARWSWITEGRFGAWSGELRLVQARAQDRPGVNETPTAGWRQVHAALHYQLHTSGAVQWSWFVIGRNLGNATVRNSASLLRNLAPEPGRSVLAGLEVRT
jgi:iron complex outermembrane receptor protein